MGARAGMSIPQGPRTDNAAGDDYGDGTGCGDGSDGDWRTRPPRLQQPPPRLSDWAVCRACPFVDATCCRADRTDRKSAAVAARVVTFSSAAYYMVTVGGRLSAATFSNHHQRRRHRYYLH